MKIVYDYQIFYFQQYGGISRYFYELARNIDLLPGGHSVNIIAGLYNNRYLKTKNSFVKGLSNTGLTKKFFYNRFYDRSEAAAIALSRLLSTKCDIYHETYYHSRLTPPKGSILFTTVHDMIYEKFPEQFAGAQALIADKKRSIFNADHIIAVSNTTKKDILGLYNIDESKITVVHHGVSPFEVQKPSSLTKEVSGKPFLLYVGRREGYKNALLLLETYLRTAELNESYDLVFFGGGGCTQQESQLIIESGAQEKVSYLQGDDEKLMWLYQNAFAFVYPSTYEGFGMPCLEAMQYNCPVIAANTPAIVEAAGNAALFFDPLNSNDLAEKIKTTAQSAVRNNLINLGKERVKEFTWTRTAEKTLAAYQQSLND